MLCPVNQKTTAVDDYAIVAVRSKSSNGKNLLAHALCNVNWNALETIDDLDSKVAYFNNCVIALLDFYLPVHYVKHHSTDKPWITDQFRRLIRQRQYAWTSGDRTQYNKLRNKINRLSKQLRKQFYSRRIRGLRDSSSHEWWRETEYHLFRFGEEIEVVVFKAELGIAVRGRAIPIRSQISSCPVAVDQVPASVNVHCVQAMGSRGRRHLITRSILSTLGPTTH